MKMQFTGEEHLKIIHLV